MKKLIIIAILIFILFMINTYMTKRKDDVIEHKELESYQLEDNESVENNDTIKFHIKGAINKPGVYTINYGSVIEDAINLAGGAYNANLNCLNLAQLIIPYQEIYIPTQSEACPIQSEGNNVNSLININTANKEQLVSLPGIGESKAQDIIEFRKTKPFKDIEELKNVNGIGENLFERIKDKITI